MKITLSWLKTHLETEATLNEIADKLSSLGLVVDSIEDKSDSIKNFKICEVVKAERHPDADRLNLCQVNTGSNTIQVVCGGTNVKEGMRAVLALPGDTIPSSGQVLKMGSIRGQESQGMLCSTEELCLGTSEDGHIISLPKNAPVGESYSEWAGLNDPILDVEITPNRGDCLGVFGIARDLAASGMGKLKPLEAPKIPAQFVAELKPVIAKDAAPYCPVFGMRQIKGIKNCESPDWLKKRLEAVGLRPISALVDITNYFTIDRGRPLHVFDGDKIKGDLNIRMSKKGESLRALDDKSYDLGDGMVVISDDKGVQSLGGIMGGLDSGCSMETTNVILEAAWFDPVITANTGRKLGILSDARYRFERGVDPETIEPGIEAATRMILDICGGQVSEVILTGTKPIIAKDIDFSPNMVATLGGTEIAMSSQKEILESLGFMVNDSGQTWIVTRPSWRPDISGPADLVEEILRINGYNKIEGKPFIGSNFGSILNPTQKRRAEITEMLAGRGLTEVVTWSFMEEKVAKGFGFRDDRLRIINPISQEMAVMRPSILPNLLMTAAQNSNRGIPTASIFEMGPIYLDQTPEGQLLVATGLRVGMRDEQNWDQQKRAFDTFDVKADGMAILGNCGLNDVHVERKAPDYYHPGRSGAFMLGKNILGYFGEIHPLYAKSCGLKSRPYAFEIFMDRLPAPRTKVAKRPIELSSLMPVERDFAFVVDQSVLAKDLLAAAKKGAGKLFSKVDLFDIYEGENLGTNNKSLAIRVTLQPETETLNEEKIQEVSNNIISEVTKRTGGVLRA